MKINEIKKIEKEDAEKLLEHWKQAGCPMNSYWGTLVDEAKEVVEEAKKSKMDEWCPEMKTTIDARHMSSEEREFLIYALNQTEEQDGLLHKIEAEYDSWTGSIRVISKTRRSHE